MKQVDQDIFRHRAEQLADAAKRVAEHWSGEWVSMQALNGLVRELDQKRRRFEEVR